MIFLLEVKTHEAVIKKGVGSAEKKTKRRVVNSHMQKLVVNF